MFSADPGDPVFPPDRACKLPMMGKGNNHPDAEDYKRICDILDSTPTINEMFLQDNGRSPSTAAAMLPSLCFI